jgi:hypothetical protein
MKAAKTVLCFEEEEKVTEDGSSLQEEVEALRTLTLPVEDTAHSWEGT